jgi:glycosyltransferase involved in cell wall biosynthesis
MALNILMLGWEYPPHISGGLGIACKGMAEALAQKGHHIKFIIPSLNGNEEGSQVELLDPTSAMKKYGDVEIISSDIKSEKTIHRMSVPTWLKPYMRESDIANGQVEHLSEEFKDVVQYHKNIVTQTLKEKTPLPEHYGDSLFDEVDRFSNELVEIGSRVSFDLIHAHDWMTFKAGLRLRHLTGKPLVIHIHSLESDRCGSFGDPRISEIEKYACEIADRIIAVSFYTRFQIHKTYDIPLEKIGVVHNGLIYNEKDSAHEKPNGDPTHPKFLFLGRVTFQKGPEYFVRAAKKIVSAIPGAKFYVAGRGDQLNFMTQMVHDLGLKNHFEFLGFVSGKKVHEAFAMADAYIMPSVSEPFGLTALESFQARTPAILSKQSGVAEVLRHSFKCDYWDVDRLADLAIGIVKYPELAKEMTLMAQNEIRALSWTSAAEKIENIYKENIMGAY